MLRANASLLPSFLSRQTRRCQTSSSPVLPEGISPSLINDEFLKDGLQSVSRQKIAHSSHDECYPPHTLHLTLGKMDSLPRCYFSTIFFKQQDRLSVMPTITTSTHQMGTFSGDRFNSFNIRVNWLLASKSLIKARDISWQAAHWWRADH